MDFFDDYDDGDFMDDSLEDSFEENCEAEEFFENDPEMANESDDAEPQEDNGKIAVIFGVAMGFAYEEGLEEAERRKLEKKVADDNKYLHNRDSKI